MQISVKFYQLVVQDPLMRLCSPKESAVVVKEKSSGRNPLISFINAIFKDNINIAILAGLFMCVHLLAMQGEQISDRLGYLFRAVIGPPLAKRSQTSASLVTPSILWQLHKRPSSSS